mmetsp:Transcript_36379/g.95323  ORF Transcript_36379/g.95323 Transcript_36379/m.95323 type:complete len:284 (-) Transcript_36379:366-1217(-)
MTDKNEMIEETLSANRYVHAFLVEKGEYEKSPHFRPENKAKVRGIIEELVPRLPTTQKLLDFGCGTGFILSLSNDLFNELVGVDITDEMMNKVDLSSGNITLLNCQAEATPFEDNTFDMATAYSFMDHLSDYKKLLAEAYRVLKPGGIFYTDLNPNRDFIVAMENADSDLMSVNPSSLLSREISGALNNGNQYEEKFGLDASTLSKAEPGKTIAKGFDASEVKAYAQALGFSQIELEYEWYIDQGSWVNNKPEGHAEVIDEYLLTLLPLTSPLYKYLRFVMIK